jgi:hypothetical protein
MCKVDEIQKLTEYFKALGADDPNSWAESEVNEGIPQYARFVFVKAAWKAVIEKDNFHWMDNLIRQSERNPNDPCSAAGAVLKRMLAAGVSKEDMTDLVRAMQYDVLFSLCYLLSDTSVADYPTDSLPRVNWALMQLNEEGEPIGVIGGLHEYVLSLDPTGREMGPRS